jgi:hypothetical protein
MQMFELALAGLRVAVHQTPRFTRSRPHRRRDDIATVKAMRNAYRRATASQNFRGDKSALRDLAEVLPAELVARISNLIDVRNNLAHRFLRDQMQRDLLPEVQRFKPGSTLRLLDAAREADAVARELRVHQRAIVDSWPNSVPVPPEVAEVVADTNGWIVFDEVPGWAASSTTDLDPSRSHLD